MNPSRLFILRPVATSLLMVAILLSGFLAYRELPLSALPEVDYPTIQVVTLYPGASPDVVTSSITAPLERITLRAGRLEPAYVRQPGLLVRSDSFKESIADAVARLQEEYGPSLVQRAEVRSDAAPLPDHRILWKPA